MAHIRFDEWASYIDCFDCRNAILPTLPTIPQLILSKEMLRPGGLLVFEHGKHNDFSDVPGFIEHRAYGSVNFSLFRATSGGALVSSAPAE